MKQHLTMRMAVRRSYYAAKGVESRLVLRELSPLVRSGSNLLSAQTLSCRVIWVEVHLCCLLAPHAIKVQYKYLMRLGYDPRRSLRHNAPLATYGVPWHNATGYCAFL